MIAAARPKTEIPRRCIKAGCPAGGTVLDPFGGAGTTARVAEALGRNAILIELNPDYAAMARQRIDAAAEIARPTRQLPRLKPGELSLFPGQ